MNTQEIIDAGAKSVKTLSDAFDYMTTKGVAPINAMNLCKDAGSIAAALVAVAAGENIPGEDFMKEAAKQYSARREDLLRLTNSVLKVILDEVNSIFPEKGMQ